MTELGQSNALNGDCILANGGFRELLDQGKVGLLRLSQVST